MTCVIVSETFLLVNPLYVLAGRGAGCRASIITRAKTLQDARVVVREAL